MLSNSGHCGGSLSNPGKDAEERRISAHTHKKTTNIKLRCNPERTKKKRLDQLVSRRPIKSVETGDGTRVSWVHPPRCFLLPSPSHPLHLLLLLLLLLLRRPALFLLEEPPLRGRTGWRRSNCWGQPVKSGHTHRLPYRWPSVLFAFFFIFTKRTTARWTK